MTDAHDALLDELPLLPLRGMVVFPPCVVPVAVSRPASIRLVDEAVVSGSLVVVSAQPGDDPTQWYAVGALVQVHRLVRLHDGTLRIALEAFDRVVIDRVTRQEPYLQVQARRLPDRLDNPDITTHMHEAQMRAHELLNALPPNEELRAQLESVDDPRHLAALMASMLLLHASLAERQELLELTDVGERLARIGALLDQELAILRGHLRM